ncbi:MAG: GNAT family N-acetyltransferase [Betaproteobacteria bacterium]|nr:GNAT family N-acetyltransferase [Betaproteobacteria bacterium]NCA17838.1 GNAT family N-acetyltransferase [Betaproteobacteria bacterium]
MMRANPKPPQKPLHLVIVNGSRGEFDVIGWLGNARVGYVVCTPLKEARTAARGQEVRVDLGGLPAWFIESAFLKDPKYRGKGYGTQLYAAAFAEAAKRSGGPVVIGSAEAIAREPYFRIGTSADAKAVWKRIIDEGIYPAHPTEQAIVFRPEDIEPWMLPAKYFEWYEKGRKR